MSIITYMAIREVQHILKKPEYQDAKNKLDTFIGKGKSSGLSRVTPSSHEFNQAPVVACHCQEGAQRIGVAIREVTPIRRETLLICLVCNGVSVKTFDECPFMFIAEGMDEPKQTKEEHEIVG